MTFTGLLNGNGNNTVAWSATGFPTPPPPTPKTYYVYRIIDPLGGTPATTGLIYSTTSTSFTDAGFLGDGTVPTYNPSLVTYKTGLNSLISTMRSQIVSLPQPRPLLAGQLNIAVSGVQTYDYACVPNFGQSGAPLPPPPATNTGCELNSITVLKDYIDALAGAGVQVVYWNLDVLPFASSAEYVNSGGTPSPLGGLSNNCASLANGLPFSWTGPPMHPGMVGTGYWCRTLAVDDVIALYVNGKGMKLRLHPAPSNFDATACSALSPVACWTPLYQAVATRWNGLIDSFTPIHEPEGAWVNCSGLCVNYWTEANLETFFAASRAAIKTLPVPPTSIPVCFSVGTDLNEGQAAAYWYQMILAATSLPPPPPTVTIDCLGLDIYSNSSDPSVQMAPGFYNVMNCGSGGPATLYPIVGTSCNWTGGAYTFVQDLVSFAKNNGFTDLRVNESNRPVFAPVNCAPTAANGVFDNAYIEFLNDGTDVAWQDAFVPWASAQGFASVSQFATQVWMWYDSLNLAHPVPYWPTFVAGGYVTQTTPSGKAWATSAQHLTSLQGGAYTSGIVHMSPPPP